MSLDLTTAYGGASPPVVNVSQIKDLGRFDMGIVTKIRDFDNTPRRSLSVAERKWGRC